MNTTIHRGLVALLTFILLVIPAFSAQGVLIPTARMLSKMQTVYSDASHQGLLARLDDEALQAKLLERGVDPDFLAQRIQSMTAAERVILQEKLDRLPAGQGALEVVLVVFLVFIITDMLGATDVFPFVHQIHH